MDANGTRFHLLLGRDDWGRCMPENATKTLAELWPDTGISPDADAAWDDERNELTLRPKLFRFDPVAADGPSISDRRGAGVDRFGNWFWIADDRQSIRVQSSGSGTTSLFWRPGIGGPRPRVVALGDFTPASAIPDPVCEPEPILLGGLAVTEDHYLVAGVTDPKGLLVFDLQAGGPPWRIAWPGGVAFEPFDITPRRRGGVWILDLTARRLWELDRHLLVVSIGPAAATPSGPGSFQPVGGQTGTARTRAGTVVLDDAAPLDGEPIAVAAARDGTVLVLDRNSAASCSLLRRYRGGAPVGTPVELVDVGLGLALRGYDMALVSTDLGAVAAPLGLLTVVGVSGNQAYAFRLSVPDDQLRAVALHRYLPLRSFGGKALAADATRPWYDFGDQFVPLAEQPRPRFVPTATVITPPLDGREPACVWHRLMLDGCIPPEASVEVWSRTGEDPAELTAAAWLPEPTPLRRLDGSELPFVPTADDAYGTWELLFQRARGRFLQVRLRLAGDERTTPRLRALRMWYPRFSYLDRYLPKVYREDAESASFLDRFLANPEGINTALEDRIAATQLLFDPDATPSEHLAWLAGWFDVALSPGWDVAKRRIFVRNAARFFAMRGTAGGLVLALRLAFERCVEQAAFDRPLDELGGPRIVERFRTRTVPAVALGDPSQPAGPRVVPAADRWRPEFGGDALNERFRRFVQAARGDAEPDPTVEFTLSPDPALAGLWSQFARAELGFVPAQNGDEAWRAFLGRRYGRIEALRNAWADASPGSFDELVLPAERLPADGTRLRDWYQFQALALPMQRTAHAFTVLLPVSTGSGDTVDEQQRRALATRVVSLQKPAHTVFDVKFFWSAFRVGEARLQLDTVIDLGSRSPALLTPLVLGRDHLGESYLAGEGPPTLTKPPSAGRQPLSR